ncbi:MAG: hypothetical protein A2750_01455 [Candidatus Yanofskybacteria bacterium RIFCSPHIGHO2_01_FULL_45_42]|uniref:Uncharacterized protein n=1 Tax=Candidatus Yanofskybacteria bacterium RIFCSPHIGHO2_01_FULL_45_42 TaxID=1802671 RepID=A0A1F8F759_9BACT|nr:MAG: hypothetical protein A2750_01455 [Candidatus Yanofskybacteria bacterium RIFCSPHIGHO2_01_FULL_45_42]
MVEELLADQIIQSSLEAVSLLDFFGGVALLDPEDGEVHEFLGTKNGVFRETPKVTFTHSTGRSL